MTREEKDNQMEMKNANNRTNPCKAYEEGVLKNLKDTLKSVGNPGNSVANLHPRIHQQLNLSKNELKNLLNR